MDTLSDSTENMLRLLKLLDFSKGYKFLSIRSALQSTIIGAIAVKNVEIVYENNPVLHYLPKEEALKFDVQ